MDLSELLRRHESKTLEFKRDLSSPEGILKTLVAFSNTAGGVLLIGVEDKTRRVSGVPGVLDAHERLANIIAETIEPRIVPDIEILPWRKTHVLAAEVYPSAARPHYVVRMGPKDGVYLRVGSTNRRADQSQIEEMRRYAQPGSFDEQPIAELNASVLDFRVASELFAPVRKLGAQSFHNLKVTTAYHKREVPTVGGYLLFAKNRFERFPDAWVYAGRFTGKDRSKVADHVQIRSPLPQAAAEAVEFVQTRLLRGSVIGPVRRSDKWALPPVAIREAVINAIVHADYSEKGAPIRVAVFDDRVEIDNPGILPLGLTIEDIQRGVSKLRNRVIGRVFQELGLIEHWGSGVQRMSAACAAAGLPPPVFQEIGSQFRVTLPMIAVSPVRVDKKDEAIFRYLADGKGHSTAEIAKKIGLSVRAARTRLAGLVDEGTVVEISSSSKDPRKRYFLNSNEWAL